MTDEQAPTGQIQLLRDVADTLARSSDLDAAAERLLALAVGSLAGSIGVVYLQDPDRVELQLGVAVGATAELGAALESALGAANDVVAATARDRVAARSSR